MRDVEAVPHMVPTNGKKRANNLNVPDQLHDQVAPTHCPVCLARIMSPSRKRLADDVVRRYRRCPNGCYEDIAVLIIIRSTTHETD